MCVYWHIVRSTLSFLFCSLLRKNWLWLDDSLFGFSQSSFRKAHVWSLFHWSDVLRLIKASERKNCVCVCVCVCVKVAQSCLTPCDPMDCSLPGSSVPGILQARILEGIAILFSRGSSWPKNWTRVSCIAGRFFTVWTTSKAGTNYILSLFTGNSCPSHQAWLRSNTNSIITDYNISALSWYFKKVNYKKQFYKWRRLSLEHLSCFNALFSSLIKRKLTVIFNLVSL